MEDFIQKVINDSTNTPPNVVVEAFYQKFNGAHNIDWHSLNPNFEAIFYLNNHEHIAIFTPNGQLLTYKIFLPKEHLPVAIKQQLEAKGEIMNVVLINNGNSIEYETIIRDTNLTRYVVHLTDLGQILLEHEL